MPISDADIRKLGRLAAALVMPIEFLLLVAPRKRRARYMGSALYSGRK